MTRTNQELYADYMGEVNRQLADAKRQVDRLVDLQEKSGFTYDDWKHWLGINEDRMGEPSIHNSKKVN